jgi:hypothetical protein
MGFEYKFHDSSLAIISSSELRRKKASDPLFEIDFILRCYRDLG